MALLNKEQSEYLNTLDQTAHIIQRELVNFKKCPKQRLTEGYITTMLKNN